MRGLFDSRKTFEGVGVFLFQGGRVHMRDLPKHDVKGGDSAWKKWIVCLFFLFLNLARLFVIWYWLCFQMSLLLYRSIAFLKFGYGPKANILIVLLITTNVMQVVSFFSLDLLSYSLLVVTRNKWTSIHFILGIIWK